MAGSRFTAAHSAGWDRLGPRNPAGPFGRSAGASDLGWGLSPWGTNALGWGDEIDPEAQRVRPAQITSHRSSRVGALARRGQFFKVPIVGRAPGQRDTPDTLTKGRRNRRQIAPARRGQFFANPGVAPGFVPDQPNGINSARLNRRLAAAMRARHGQSFGVPLDVTVTPPVTPDRAPDQTMGLRKRRLFALARHGVFFSVPPAAVVVTDTSVPSSTMGLRKRRLFALARRGRFYDVPLESWRAAPVFRDQNQRRGLLPRRGVFFRHPLAGTNVPDRIKSRSARYGFLARRGQFSDLPLAGINVPDRTRSRFPRTLSPTRRGAFSRFPLVGRAPGQLDAPDRIKSRYARALPPARRGQFTEFPLIGFAPGQIDALDRIKSQRPSRVFALARRGRNVWPPPTIIIAPPGSQALPPDRIEPANRARTFALARRGRIVYRPLLGLVPAPPIVPDRIGRPRVRSLSVRRSSGFELPVRTYGPPPARIVRSGARPAVAAPRRRRHLFVPPTVAAPTAPPSRIVSRRVRGLSARRSRRFLVRLDTPVAFTGTAINYVIVQAPLRFVSPALVRLAVAGIDASLDIDLTVIRLSTGDALVLEVEADGTATFQGQQGSKVIIVREL